MFLFSVKLQHELAIGLSYIHSLLNLPPFTIPIPSSKLMQRPCLSFLIHTVNSHWLTILHIVRQVSMLLFSYISPSLPLYPVF